MKYFHLSLHVVPHMCEGYTQQIVISEDPLAWTTKNKNHHPHGGGDARMTQYREINQETYNLYKKNNPRIPDGSCPESCRILIMNKRDYS